MAHVCPWWGGYFIDNRLRRWLHDPRKLLSPYVRPGMTCLDLGCGMGIFSIAMAQMAGAAGKVIAVDLQPQMLDVLRRRAAKAGVADRIETHQAKPDRIDLAAEADFALAFAMVHEVPDARNFLREVRACLRPGAKFFIAEPRGHVPRAQFEAMVAVAEELGMNESDRPRVRLCQAIVLERAR